jgi:hypothetical protein
MGVFDWTAAAARNIGFSGIESSDGASARSFPVSLRALMASVRQLADDQGGAITTGGTLANAYTVRTQSGVGSFRPGIKLTIRADRSNTAEATLNVDGTGPRPWLDADGIDLTPARIRAGRFYTIVASPDETWRTEFGPGSIEGVAGLTDALGGKAGKGTNGDILALTGLTDAPNSAARTAMARYISAIVAALPDIDVDPTAAGARNAAGRLVYTDGLLPGRIDLRDLGARPGQDIYPAFARGLALARIAARPVTLVLGAGLFPASAELIIDVPNVELVGQGDKTVIMPQTYGWMGVGLFAPYTAARRLKVVNPYPKTPLSTALANRYRGDVARCRASGIYVAASYCVVEDISTNGMINGVYAAGGDRYQAVPQLVATRTVKLAASDAKSTDIFTGSKIRCFFTSGATGWINIIAYNVATNTVTVEDDIAITGSPTLYVVIGPNHTDNKVRRIYPNFVDFGVLSTGQNNFEIYDIETPNVIQTQETNARPHTVYVSGDNGEFGNANVRIGRIKCDFSPDGHVVKARNVKGLTIENVVCTRSRGGFAVETCADVQIATVASRDMGPQPSRPEIGNIIDCSDVKVSDLKGSVLSTYTDKVNGVAHAGLRPIGLLIDGLGVGANPNTSTNVTVDGVQMTFRGDIAGGYAVYVGETGTVPCAGINLRNLTSINESAAPVASVRAFASSGTIRGLSHVGPQQANPVLLESTATNWTADLSSRTVSGTALDGGVGNKVIRDGVLTGTFLPALLGGTVPGTQTYSVQIGRVVRKGDECTVYGRLTLTGHSMQGEIRLTNLPYAPRGDFSVALGEIVPECSGLNAGANRTAGWYIVLGQNYAVLKAMPFQSSGSTVIDAASLAANGRVDFKLTYLTSDPL